MIITLKIHITGVFHKDMGKVEEWSYLHIVNLVSPVISVKLILLAKDQLQPTAVFIGVDLISAFVNPTVAKCMCPTL